MSPTKVVLSLIVNHVHRQVGLYGSGIKYVHCTCGTCGLPFVLKFIKMLIQHISHDICNIIYSTVERSIANISDPSIFTEVQSAEISIPLMQAIYLVVMATAEKYITYTS